jgi:hypothetical protein
MIIGGSPVDVSLAAARPQCRRSCLWAERVGWAPATAIFDPLRVQMDSNIEQVTTVVGVFGAARLRSLPRSAQQGSEPSLFASLVGLRGYKLNPAIKRYLAAGLAVHEACREPPHRQHRIAKRLPAGTLRSWSPSMAPEPRQLSFVGGTAWRKAPCSMSCGWPAYPSVTHG